ncbi:unnamed protein product [Larinioides sclopetarius]|uniref:Uncharacterized protein n=1 Tax=Larinioides sclopetarius TaxID=280406 RepID=A0AAV2ACJ5_9ARAC
MTIFRKPAGIEAWSLASQLDSVDSLVQFTFRGFCSDISRFIKSLGTCCLQSIFMPLG